MTDIQSIEDLRPLEEMEREIIRTAVVKWPNRKPEIAAALGMCLKTLYNKLDRYGLDTDGRPLCSAYNSQGEG